MCAGNRKRVPRSGIQDPQSEITRSKVISRLISIHLTHSMRQNAGNCDPDLIRGVPGQKNSFFWGGIWGYIGNLRKKKQMLRKKQILRHALRSNAPLTGRGPGSMGPPAGSTSPGQPIPMPRDHLPVLKGESNRRIQ